MESAGLRRPLGRSGIDVSAVGAGCWAIGGPLWSPDGGPSGWGAVNDDESVAAIHAAVDMGIDLFDTADVYGAGHSERILGSALTDRRDRVTIATKFSYLFDEQTRTISGVAADAASIRRACEASLRRLRTDWIDLYQFHAGDFDTADSQTVLETLEALVAEGKIRSYGWSTDDPARAELFARGRNCAAIQQAFNVLSGNRDTLRICEEQNLASIVRGPLAMGLLTGKFDTSSTIPQDDVRRGWNFSSGSTADALQNIARVRDVLTDGGRTLAQGALCWLLAHSQVMIPIPGFRTVRQITENAGALALGPLSTPHMRRIDELLGRVAT